MEPEARMKRWWIDRQSLPSFLERALNDTGAMAVPLMTSGSAMPEKSHTTRLITPSRSCSGATAVRRMP